MSSCSCPELSGTWWRSAATLRTVLDNHDGPTDAAQAHGAIQSTLSVWSRRHGFPKGTPGGKVQVRQALPDALLKEVPWGHGKAELVRPATKEATEIVVSGSDFHFPYHEVAAIESFLNLIEKVQPHRVVLNGDINDFFQCSRFNKNGDRAADLEDDIGQGNTFRGEVRRRVPNAVIDEPEGNHCRRIRDFLSTNAPQFANWKMFQRAELFKHNEYEINGHPGCGFLVRENFLIRHGSVVRAGAGASARGEMTKAGVSGWSGHTHRLATVRKVDYQPKQWSEQGCLCRLDPDYIEGQPDWTQGIVVGEFSTKSDAFSVYEVPFVGGKLRLGREAF